MTDRNRLADVKVQKPAPCGAKRFTLNKAGRRVGALSDAGWNRTLPTKGPYLSAPRRGLEPSPGIVIRVIRVAAKGETALIPTFSTNNHRTNSASAKFAHFGTLLVGN